MPVWLYQLFSPKRKLEVVLVVLGAATLAWTIYLQLSIWCAGSLSWACLK